MNHHVCYESCGAHSQCTLSFGVSGKLGPSFTHGCASPSLSRTFCRSVYKIGAWTHLNLASNPMSVKLINVSYWNRGQWRFLTFLKPGGLSEILCLQELETMRKCGITCSLESSVGHLEGGSFSVAEIIIWLFQSMNYSSEGASQVVLVVKNLSDNARDIRDSVWSPGQEDLLEEGLVT